MNRASRFNWTARSTPKSRLASSTRNHAMTRCRHKILHCEHSDILHIVAFFQDCEQNATGAACAISLPKTVRFVVAPLQSAAIGTRYQRRERVAFNRGRTGLRLASPTGRAPLADAGEINVRAAAIHSCKKSPARITRRALHRLRPMAPVNQSARRSRTYRQRRMDPSGLEIRHRPTRYRHPGRSCRY